MRTSSAATCARPSPATCCSTASSASLRPWHSMIVTRIGAEPRWSTTPAPITAEPGELRRVRSGRTARPSPAAMAAGARQSQLSRRLPLEYSARNSMIFGIRRSVSCCWSLLFCSFAPPAQPPAASQGRAALLLALHYAHLRARRERKDPASRPQRAGARISRLQSARRGEVLRRPQRPAQLRRAELFAAEQIDQRTWIERLHDFKAHLWWLVRHFFRGQFTDEARDSFREQPGQAGQAQPGGGRDRSSRRFRS